MAADLAGDHTQIGGGSNLIVGVLNDKEGVVGIA